MRDKKGRTKAEQNRVERQIDEMSKQSFPASDPPSVNTSHAGAPAPPGAHDSALVERQPDDGRDEQ